MTDKENPILNLMRSPKKTYKRLPKKLLPRAIGG